MSGRRYVLEIIIDEGSDEFWEEIRSKGHTGCDEVVSVIREGLHAEGWHDAIVTMKAFMDDGA